MARPTPKLLSLCSIFFAVQLAPQAAHALQPLQQFVDGAKAHSPDALEVQANLDAQQAQADVALGRALPGLSVRGTYTRNQYDVELPLSLLQPGAPDGGTIILTPFDQLDATASINVPLVDLSSFTRIAAARTAARSAESQAAAVQLQIEARVVQGYYQLVADLALVSASQRALQVAQAGEKITHTRVQLGQSPALEEDRARAEVERQVQQLAGAELQVSVAAQALDSQSGIAPELGATVELSDDLHEEPALAEFQPPPEGTPAMAAAAQARKAAEQQASAQRLALVPSLAGSFTEHASNYAGFSGHDASFQAVLALSWNIDYASFAAIRAQAALARAAAARETRASLATRDAIHDSWAAVRAAIARARSARVQEQVTRHAAALAQDRYQAGASTQLDLLQAQRDAFSAEAARIQAVADLANARDQLRLAAGRDPLASGAAP